MFINRKGLVVAMLLGVVTACSSPTSTVMVGDKRPPTTAEQVKIYVDKPANYEAIAMIEASSDSSFSFSDQSKLEAAVKRLKEEAAKVGANGILLQGTDEKRGDSVYVGAGTGGFSGNLGLGVNIGKAFAGSDKVARGLAIYVIAEDDASASSNNNDKQ
ncbi:hypothetical protein [Idiomarina xiamenensis]|uniref:Lipoprotein n=1 Tax=Idiomarina xiamenensis 10-D-4 TaxID=740709 RepID=K2KGF0_9GAMM|nr:hypothetical protein [Idiomarina xiamenensis]EKE87068.1 hypothetical protein A10D4_02462 [Idiomarina xiamenensis 10-D-4]